MLRILILYLFLIPSVFAANFALSSAAIDQDTPLNQNYTCDGKNMSPDLFWANIPTGTKSFTIILSDPDAPEGTFYHWIMYNIPSGVTSLLENGNVPSGAALGKNSIGKIAYTGPCPPRMQTHHYIFTIYALDTKLQIPTGSSIETVFAAMNGHVLGQTKLTTTYGFTPSH